ncbi:hypothetical protein N2152v2_002555 [Parachlorella kessleri]
MELCIKFDPLFQLDRYSGRCVVREHSPMVVMNPQVLLVASSVEGNISAWDIATNTQLTSYKGNASPANGLSLLGRDYLIANQKSKGSLHFWTWHKDQVHQRSFAVEPLTAVAATADALYCAAGGTSGSIYIWEVSSGRLLRSWPAHYKAVTVLAFNDSGSILVSGGEDTLVNAWLLAEVLDSSAGSSSFGGFGHSHGIGAAAGPAAAGPAASAGLGGGFQLGGGHALRPLHSWSDHTLAVTGLVVGAGDGNAVVVSSSLDHSVKVRSLVQGGLLLAVAFPAAIHSVALDPGEHALYAGSASGTIYELSLVDGSSGAGGSSGPHDSSGEAPWVAMEGHSRPVTCLAFSGDAAYLVSGSEDQSVRVWDLQSRQQVRLLQNPAKGPVTGLLVIDRPPFMQVGGSHAASASSQGTSSKKGPKRPQPLAPFAKYANTPGVLKPWEGGLVILDGSCQPPAAADGGDGGLVADAWPSTAAQPPLKQPGRAAGGDGSGADAAAGGGGAAGGLGTQEQAQTVRELQEENERLRQQLARALQAAQQWGEVNTQLQQMCSDMLVGR